MNIEIIRPSSRLNATSNIRISTVVYKKSKLYVGFANGDFSVFDVDITFVPQSRKPPLMTSFKSLNDIRSYFSESKSSNFSHDITFPNIHGDSTGISRMEVLSINQATNRIILALANQDTIKIFEKVGTHLNLIQNVTESKNYVDFFSYDINECNYIAIGIKKKLMVFQRIYKTRNLFQYHKIHECTMKDRIKVINSINLDLGFYLLVGLTTDFVVIDVTNGFSVKSLFPEITDTISGFNLTSFTYFGLTNTGPSMSIIKITDDEYCLIKDTQILMVYNKESGLSFGESKVKLNSVPLYVGSIYPSYLLIIYTKNVEIVEITTGEVIQKIHHQINTNFIPICITESFIFLGAINDLLQFNICSYEQQIDQYLKCLENDKAVNISLKALKKVISLVERIDEEDEFFGGFRVGKEKRKQLYLRDLYKSKAIILFEKMGLYHESLVSICSEWLISYKDVLGLFPRFLGMDYYTSPADPSVDKLSKSFIKKISVEEIHNLNWEDPSEADDIHSRITQLGTTNLKRFQKAVNNLIVYLSDQRRIHLNFFHEDTYFWKNINVTPYDLYDFVTPQTYKQGLEQIAIEIDTSLFLCYYHCRPTLLGPLLRLPNNKCDSNIVNECLLNPSQHGRHHFLKELLDFYYGRGLHKDALEMLYKLKHETQVDQQIDALMIQYLQMLNNTYLDLVLRFAKELIQENHEYGKLIFMNDTYECESYDNLKIVEFLIAQGNVLLASKYLEWVIFNSDLAEKPSKAQIIPQLHTKLGVLYLSILLSPDTENMPIDQFQHLQHYKTLSAFLKNTDTYEPWTVLKHIPTDNPNFLKFTIPIYKRLGEHDKAIDVLYNQLEDLDEAIAYCSDIYNATNKEYGSNLLHKLLEDLLMHYTENIDPIKKLLVSQGCKMSTLKVLTSLPNSFPIFKLTTYLDEQLRKSTQVLIDTRVSSQLYKVGSIKLKNELLTTQSQGYLIESSKKLCSICGKRLGYSVFSVDNGNVVHYACQARTMNGKR